MSESNQTLDLERIKILSKPQYIGLLIGFIFTIGVNYNSFKNMSKDIDKLSSRIGGLRQDIASQNDKIDNRLVNIQERTAKLEGKLDLLIKK